MPLGEERRGVKRSRLLVSRHGLARIVERYPHDMNATAEGKSLLGKLPFLRREYDVIERKPRTRKRSTPLPEPRYDARRLNHRREYPSSQVCETGTRRSDDSGLPSKR